MDCLSIQGGTPLSGTISAAGSKNAALAIMAASLLADGPVRLTRVPRVGDVTTLGKVLAGLGMVVERRPVQRQSNVPQSITRQSAERGASGRDELWLEAVNHDRVEADPRLVRKMRATFCVLGPLLARRGCAVAVLPGGCRIGARPIDLHLSGLAALGAEIHCDGQRVVARARQLRGAIVNLLGPCGPTVTGTANVMSAATLARGRTVILGAAREPEIVDLGVFLKRLGARIEGLGTGTIEIQGVEQLGGASHTIMPDRIEAATLLLAGAITGGAVRVTDVVPEHLSALLDALAQMGLSVEQGEDWVAVHGRGRPLPADLDVRPYPGLPTDLQAPLTVLLCVAQGQSNVCDHVFPERFGHVQALKSLGARIVQTDSIASMKRVQIEGVPMLHGASVAACDLRTAAALVLAGLAAQGHTTVRRLAHLDRGYESLETKLRWLGATIDRVPLADSTNNRQPLVVG